VTSAVQARASRPRNFIFARSITARLGNMNARAMCAQNSTPMPTQMIRLTRLTALRGDVEEGHGADDVDDDHDDC